MAKKGKRNLLYVLECDNLEYMKIGICTSEDVLERRIKTLQTGNPKKINLVHAEERISAKDAEIYLHQCFDEYRQEGEWFKGITLHDIRVKLMLFHDQD